MPVLKALFPSPAGASIGRTSSGHTFSDHDVPLSGHALWATWFEDAWGEAARGVVLQFVVFYSMMLIGFIFLFVMMKSTTRLRELRRSVAETVREQRNRKFDVDQYGAMPGGGFM